MVTEEEKVVGPLEELQAADLRRHLEEDWDALLSGPSSARADRRREPAEAEGRN
jgi:hypothetical protein